VTIYEPKEMTVDVIEQDGACKRGAVPCRIGGNIRFETEALESFSTHRWDPVIYDAFLVAAAVEFCDRTLVRSSMNWAVGSFYMCLCTMFTGGWTGQFTGL